MLFLISFIFSLVFTGLVIHTSHYHKHFTHDHDMNSKHKYHKTPVPRIGGLGILVSFLLSLIIIKFNGISAIIYTKNLITPLLVVFFAGFSEDLTKTITPLERTLFFVIALIIAIYLTNTMSVIHTVGYHSIDHFMETFPFIGFGLTFLCVIGLTNAYNIIDGYNGLCTIAAIINLVGLAGIEYLVNDIYVASILLGFVGALLGFLVYNYPKGKIFLGDGGAYMIGFVIAVSSIKIIERHAADISPYALLLMAVFPITELGFSIYRKRFLSKVPPTQPDGLHMHMIIYKRCTNMHSAYRNSLVVIILLCLIIPQIIFALIFHKNSTYCLFLIVAYIFIYVFFYFRIVRFKTPVILKIMLSRRKKVGV